MLSRGDVEGAHVRLELLVAAFEKKAGRVKLGLLVFPLTQHNQNVTISTCNTQNCSIFAFIFLFSTNLLKSSGNFILTANLNLD